MRIKTNKTSRYLILLRHFDVWSITLNASKKKSALKRTIALFQLTKINAVPMSCVKLVIESRQMYFDCSVVGSQWLARNMGKYYCYSGVNKSSMALNK